MPKRNLIWLIVIVAFTAVLGLVLRPHRSVSISARKQFRPVVHTYSLIKEHYVEPMDDEELARKAIRAMVGELDKYSTYIPQQQVQMVQDHMLGLEHGLGLVWEFEDSAVKILGPLPDSPAWRAGICTGDEIVEIDGQATAELGKDKICELLDPQQDDRVALTVLRGGRQQEHVTLAADKFPIRTVTGMYRRDDSRWVYRLPPAEDKGLPRRKNRSPAYIRIREFVRTTGEQFRQAVRQAPLRDGMILDLRDNPGGLLPVAVETADMFLRDGPIVTVVERDGPPELYRAHADGTLPDGMLVVLVNSETASAAELLAGTLLAGDRAVIIGAPTRGKHCIQSMFPLGDEMGQLNLTTSRFFVGEYEPEEKSTTPQADNDTTAEETSHTDEPVTPDLLVEVTDEQLEKIRCFRRRQEVLRRRGETRTDDNAPRPRQYDPQLAAAEELLNNPRKYYSIIAERKRRRSERTSELKATSE